jgi:hypothetical protein
MTLAIALAMSIQYNTIGYSIWYAISYIIGYAVDFAIGYSNGYAICLVIGICIGYFIGYPSLFIIGDASKLLSMTIALELALILVRSWL